MIRQGEIYWIDFGTARDPLPPSVIPASWCKAICSTEAAS